MGDAERESTESVSEKGAAHSKLSRVKGKFSLLASFERTFQEPSKVHESSSERDTKVGVSEYQK